ncbi:MAG: hypothetical protein IJY04_10995, partial [Clostridia bacterium]|nr:hypothetical protein [Clostridia bacterium]
GTERVYPFCDYTVTSDSKWNYAFESSLEPEYSESEIGECPFSAEGAPCHITVNAREIPWIKEFGRCRPRPESLEPVSDTVRIELIPYGCTHLRMTELPMI